MLRPLAQLPLRRDSHALPRDAIPHDLLLVDVDSATGDGLTGQRLYCAARLEGAGVDGGPPPTAGVASGRRTRGVVATASDAGSAAEAAWHERLAVPLPSRPAAEHALIFDVWNADAGGGKGAKLGSGTLNVAVKSLDHRKPCTMQVNVTANGNSDGSSSDCVCVLNITYMLQNQWRGRLVEVGPKDDWTTPESTKGQRALSLSTIPGTWAVIPTFGQQRASSGESAVNNAGAFSSITALKVGAESVILEGSLVDEEWHEVLRAPCQVVNSTELLLEVGLLTKEDGDWEAVAKPLLPSGAAATPNVLGRVEPGKVLPLPLNWRQPGKLYVIPLSLNLSFLFL